MQGGEVITRPEEILNAALTAAIDDMANTLVWLHNARIYGAVDQLEGAWHRAHNALINADKARAEDRYGEREMDRE
jgi:hypothetical protein